MRRILLNVIIITFSGLICFNAFAQRPAFVRKQIQPDFFVPEIELKEKKEVLPTQFRAALPPKASVVKNNSENSVRKDNKEIYDEETLDIDQYTYYSGSERVSEYKKVYDEYIKDLKHLKKYKELPANIEKDRDLAKMNTERVFVVK